MEEKDSWSWLLIVIVVAVVLLVFFVLFHIVITPHGPTRMALIPKRYASFRLTVVFLPSWVDYLQESVFPWEVQEDALAEHLLESLYKRGSLEKELRR